MYRLILLATLCVMLSAEWGRLRAEEPITLVSELRHLHTVDHLYTPQTHRLLQYSGFHREGGNPDRYDHLYKDDGWRVIADHQGPGVVSRIWTTHREKWTDIRIEVDGKIVFSGLGNEFFEQEGMLFVNPLSVVRTRYEDTSTHEREPTGRKRWAVSYVPIPFKKRFRYMQREQVYVHIDVKAFDPDTTVESFIDANPDEAAEMARATKVVWDAMDPYANTRSHYQRIHKMLSMPAQFNDSPSEVSIADLSGPGIIREIRIKPLDNSATEQVDLTICWDDAASPDFVTPIDQGFGSRRQRNLAFGQSEDRWRYCRLPMPFRQSAQLSLKSESPTPGRYEIELLVEQDADLPVDMLYLRSYQNEGKFFQNGKFDKPNLPLASFFYHNGYTALAHRGSGHLVAYMDLFECQAELDEHVFIDEERTFPENRWNGTGHEDFFDMAWGHSSFSSPMASGGGEKFEEVNVRLFWNDPMTFRRSIRFNWEWAFKYGIPAPRDAHFASVVYWYESPKKLQAKQARQ